MLENIPNITILLFIYVKYLIYISIIRASWQRSFFEYNASTYYIIYFTYER